jgi:5,10-methylene-tetrahydrofolate dehydrogenase/methenyl tetrahydrofolate cyclohydrolase
VLTACFKKTLNFAAPFSHEKNGSRVKYMNPTFTSVQTHIYTHIHTYMHTHNRYVALKQQAARSCGIDTIDYRLSENAAESDVLYCVNLLNDDPDVDGILVQLPLPPHLDQADILAAISVDKDGNCLFSSSFFQLRHTFT